MSEEKKYWKNPIFKKYYADYDMRSFKRIDDISAYNWNYYIGIDNDLLFAKSDDDNTTEWYLIKGDNVPFYLGVSYVSNRDLLQHEPNF